MQVRRIFSFLFLFSWLERKMSSFSQMWYLSLPAVPSEVYLTKRYVNTSSFPYKNAQITDIYGIYAVKSRVNNVVNYALLELTLTPVVQFFLTNIIWFLILLSIAKKLCQNIIFWILCWPFTRQSMSDDIWWAAVSSSHQRYQCAKRCSFPCETSFLEPISIRLSPINA